MKIKTEHISLGGAAKAVLRRKFIVFHVYVRKEKSFVNQ